MTTQEVLPEKKNNLQEIREAYLANELRKFNLVKFAYKKRYYTNCILIPVFFFLIAFLCLRKPPQHVVTVSTVTLFLSLLVQGFCLIENCYVRVKKENPKKSDYEKASDAMHLASCISLTFAAIAIGVIIIFG